MRALVVLGNRLNDDGTLSYKALKRCEITKNAINIFKPDKVILTGGIANKKTSISEARALYNYLSKDINHDLFILEEQATTTTENAIFSFEICQKIGINEVVIISSIEHFGRIIPKSAITCFRDVNKNYPNIKLSMYTEEN